MNKNSIRKIIDLIYKNRIVLIFVFAIIIRIIFIVRVPYYACQHDLGKINEDSHLGYIYTIYKTGHLPTTNSMEFYHPPLFHLLGAGVLKISSFFSASLRVQLELLQYLSLIISIVSLVFIYKIINRVVKNDNYKSLILLIFSFSPFFIFMSGSINNDILMIMNFIITIYLLLKWYDDSSIKNTFLLALFTGLCVFSKMNGALVSIPIMYMFINKYLSNYDKKYIKLFLLLCFISLPIGLWYPIRNYILFKQPLFYVLTDNLDTVYIGNYSYIQRFFSFSFDQYFHIFAYPHHYDYNIWAYLIKTSLFDEFGFGDNIFHVSLFFIHTALIIFLLYQIFSYSMSKRKNIYINCFLITCIFILLSFLLFNVKYPYACSMNFRYITVTSILGWSIVGYQLSLNNYKKSYYLFKILVLIYTFLSIIIFL